MFLRSDESWGAVARGMLERKATKDKNSSSSCAPGVWSALVTLTPADTNVDGLIIVLREGGQGGYRELELLSCKLQGALSVRFETEMFEDGRLGARGDARKAI